MKREHRILIISGITIVYMIAAFSWWSVLPHRKNNEIFELKKEVINLKNNSIDPSITAQLQSAEDKYASQTKMIWGESAVFMCSLLLSCWLLYRAFKKEIEISRNQKNFLLSVTHELKSPIASLLLSIDTIRKRKLEEATQHRLLDNAKEDTRRLESLVQNILFSTKLEGAYQFNFEKVNITNIIRKIVKKKNQQFGKDIIEITQPDTQVELVCDKESIISLADNLINNAIKYSGDKDPKLNIEINQNGKSMIIRFKDQGIGISEPEKVKIFKKFYRIGNEETRKTTGTGLGLYIVKQIADAHNGSITINDNQPFGSIFNVQLPLNL